MSNILRSTLKYSVKQFGINCLKFTDSVIVSRSSPCISHLLNHNFYTSAPCNSHEKIEKYIKKLDQDARRMGRISLREVEDVVGEIKSLRSASATQSLMVIRCCGNLISEESPEKRTELVQEVWKTFEKLGIRLDISHYNALLRVYLENEHPFVPTDILAELEQKGLVPNRVTYQRFITRYCQNGDMDGATRILEFMREKEMPINEIVFNALVLGHSQANDMESAEGILNVMKQAGIDPSAETYTILICGYIKQGDMEKVKALLQECESNDIYFIDRDYLEMVYHLGLYNQNVDEVLSKLRRNTGYNQEAINYIYKLISAGKTDPAYKILESMVRSTRLDGTPNSTGGFFVAALVRHNRPTAEIIEYCDKLMNENLNLQALNIAMESSLRYKKEDIALELFRAAQKRSIPLRTHYFWPLLVARGKKNDANGIFKILSVMTSEFNVAVNSETIRDYVIPFTLKKNTNIPGLLVDLKSCGASTASGVSSIVTHLLLSGKISEAALIASSYKAFYPVFLIRKPLIKSFLKTGDAESLTTLLKEIAAGIRWRAGQLETAEKGDEEEIELPEYRESVGQIVVDIVKELQKNDNNCIIKIEDILKLMLEKGIGISSRIAEAIQNQLQDKLTQEISTYLEKLTDDDLSISESSSGGLKFSPQNVSEDSLIRLYESMKAKGESSKNIQKQLFTIYGRNNNLEKLLELKEEMEKDNFVFTNGMLAYLIDTYVEREKFDDAWQLYKSRVNEEPDFALNPVKMLRLALSAVKNEQYDKAIELLSKKAVLSENFQQPDNSVFVTGSLCWRILSHFAEKGDIEKVKEFFNLIVDNQYCPPNNILLGNLIKVHIANNDIEGALKEFENCCVKYRATPWKGELAKRCIESENAQSLQRLTDLSTQIHGETNSLYDLMLSFLECGRLKQAKKILETPGLRLRQDRLENACQNYQNQGAIEHLENLLTVTKDLNSLNRSDLYYNLLLAYDKAGEAQKALSLWMQMQEEDETPSDAFLILLASVLQKNGLSVPFTVPALVEKPPRVQQSDARTPVSESSKKFRKLLQNEKIDDAINFKNGRGSEKLNNTDLSLLLESLIKQGRYKEGKELLEEISKRGVLPMNRILKFFVINAMIQGDVEILEKLQSQVNDRISTILKLRNRICQAHTAAGRISEYMDILEKQIDAVSSKEDVESFLNDFPGLGILKMLEKEPAYLNRVQRIADKCLEINSQHILPINIVWMHHLMNKNFEEAEKIWKNYLQHSDKKIYFKSICHTASDKKDLEILLKLKDFLESRNNNSPAAVGIVYGHIINTLVAEGKVSEAVNFLEEAASKIPIDNIMVNALHTLKAACASKNIPFKYTIPQRARSNNDNSDSD